MCKFASLRAIPCDLTYARATHARVALPLSSAHAFVVIANYIVSISQWARPGALVLSGCIFPVLLFDKLGLGVRSFHTILRKLNCWQARSALLSRVCVCVLCVCVGLCVCVS